MPSPYLALMKAAAASITDFFSANFVRSAADQIELFIEYSVQCPGTARFTAGEEQFASAAFRDTDDPFVFESGASEQFFERGDAFFHDPGVREGDCQRCFAVLQLAQQEQRQGFRRDRKTGMIALMRGIQEKF